MCYIMVVDAMYGKQFAFYGSNLLGTYFFFVSPLIVLIYRSIIMNLFVVLAYTSLDLVFALH